MQKTRCQPVFDRNASNWTAIAFASAMTIGLPWLALPAFGAVSPPTSVVSWGHESSGTIVPLDLGDAVAVRSSGNFSLAIRADGTVAVWGDPFPGTPEALAQVHDAKMISL